MLAVRKPAGDDYLALHSGENYGSLTITWLFAEHTVDFYGKVGHEPSSLGPDPSQSLDHCQQFGKLDKSLADCTLMQFHCKSIELFKFNALL